MFVRDNKETENKPQKHVSYSASGKLATDKVELIDGNGFDITESVVFAFNSIQAANYLRQQK